MKTFVLKSLIYSTACIVVGALMLILSDYILANRNLKFSHEINVKRQLMRLNNIESPKVIIIGGSGCGFGIVSTRIEDELGLPVCNTGTHAGIGILTMTELFKDYIHKGDIICLVPEYSQFFDSYYLGEGALLRQALTLSPVRDKLSCEQVLHLVKYLPEPIIRAEESSPYNANSLNEEGDVCMYDARLHMDSLQIKAQEHSVGDNLQEKAIDIVKNFATFCMDREAKLLFLPPALDSIAYVRNEDKIRKLCQELLDNGIPYEAAPKQFVLADTLFFDSPYHMTYQGALIRTQMLIAEIRKSCYSL